jgi:NADPH-dependent 2,4-dienoyl-CoA reductase/sulfur reductase-like enzyme
MQGGSAVRTVILLTGVVSVRSFTLPLRQIFGAGRVLEGATRAAEAAGASAACMSSPAPQPFRVGVVGAGIAGCTLARRLKDAGADVTVFEMGRGAGGRMATRKTRDFPVSWLALSTPAVPTAISHAELLQGLAINHGAPLFVAKQEPFLKLLEPLLESGAVKEYRGRVMAIDGGTPGGGSDATLDGKAYVSNPDMNTMW